MRVTLTEPPGLFVDGALQNLISEQDAPYPNLVIEMSVPGMSHPVTVALDQVDLCTIVRLAKRSKFQTIRDAVRWP